MASRNLAFCLQREGRANYNDVNVNMKKFKELFVTHEKGKYFYFKAFCQGENVNYGEKFEVCSRISDGTKNIKVCKSL